MLIQSWGYKNKQKVRIFSRLYEKRKGMDEQNKGIALVVGTGCALSGL